MLPYWLAFLIPAMHAISAQPDKSILRARQVKGISQIPWMFAWIFLSCFIGFRFNVGGDWINYLHQYYESRYLKFSDIQNYTDPGYWVLNLIANNLQLGYSAVNLISGMIFSAGLIIFCRSTPHPWLALAVSVPYMVIVVAMGYTRQSVALGIALIGFVCIFQRKYIKFLLFILLAATFHRTVILLIPIALFTCGKNKVVNIFLIFSTFAMGYWLFLAESDEMLVNEYIYKEMQSSGAMIRLFMNFVPAVIFLRYRKEFYIDEAQYKLWCTISIISVAFVILFFVTNASTALDRMALYAIPLQIFVFSHLPLIYEKMGGRKSIITPYIILYYGAVLFIWLNFAVHAKYWVPYSAGWMSEDIFLRSIYLIR